jgi:spore germination protein KA
VKKYEKKAIKLTNKKGDKKQKAVDIKNNPVRPSEAQNRIVFTTIDDNFGFLTSILGESIGLTQTKYDIFEGNAQVGISYIQNNIDMNMISSYIVKPLIKCKADFLIDANQLPVILQSKLIHVPDVTKSKEMNQIVSGLLTGYAIVFLEGISEALLVGCKKADFRAVEAPNNEVTVLASMDSFTEDLETNCSMVSRRLVTPDLHFEEYKVGKLSNTKVMLLWFDGISNQKVVEEIQRRISDIDIDNIDGIGELAELIVEKPLSIFPKYRQTQRPDLVARKLTEGYTAILCSNSPFALIAPLFFVDNFKTMDDYSENFFISSFLRLVRVLAFLLSAFLSALYVSFVTYNQSIIPSTLATNIATGRDGVPLPTIVEVLLLSLIISIIREASLRLPGSVGYFIGSLAAVVIGQSAVTAGYVSASVIIVIAVSAISSYAISTTTMVYPARLINYFMIIMAGTFGIFGLFNGIILISLHLVSIRSFGMPYMYPLIPFDKEAVKDSIIRAPLANIKKRPGILVHNNPYRTGNSSKSK